MHAVFKAIVALLAALPCAGGALAASAAPPAYATVATVDEIEAFFRGEKKTVVTFVGYSGAGYEDPQRMLAEAGAVLDRYPPATTIVNLGATPDGIGAVYELAKRRGFTTTGIVSTQARDNGVTLSPAVDRVFYVQDASWGGIDVATGALSPTSRAMVNVSDVVIGIGGGDIARDELAAARRANKHARFVPADMNHRTAIDAAARRGRPAPADFRGSAHAAFGR